MGKFIDRLCLVLGVVLAAATLYYTAGIYYGWDKAIEASSKDAGIEAMPAPWWLYVTGVLAVVSIITGWSMMARNRKSLFIFLEKDSNGDRLGIQSFPGITYIQPSVRTSVPLQKCRAWASCVEYRPTEYEPYAIEQNERHALGWSKYDSPEIDLNPNDPPVRMNVVVYDDKHLRYEVVNPTNVFDNLQRVGFHRFTLTITGFRGVSQIVETRYLTVDWRGPSGGAIVSLE